MRLFGSEHVIPKKSGRKEMKNIWAGIKSAPDKRGKAFDLLTVNAKIEKHIQMGRRIEYQKTYKERLAWKK